MERRKHKRCTPEQEVIVALLSPPQKHITAVMGRLIDISRSGSAIAYLPLEDTVIPEGSPCEFMLKKFADHPFTKPLGCEIVYGTPLNSGSTTEGFYTLKRYGIKFTSLLPSPDFQQIIGA
jgi:hypothetical protein